MIRTTVALGAVLLGVAACGPRDTGPAPEPEADTVSGSASLPIVPERWLSPWDSTGNLDSPAYWSGADTHLVIVAAKDSHDLWVVDAVSGIATDPARCASSNPCRSMRSRTACWWPMNFSLELEAYDLEGHYTGRTVAGGLYAAGDPEGIMLYRCGPQDGYWVLTDQGAERTVFHILERSTLEHVGSFTGRLTANTDGIWLTQDSVPQLGAGALFALHDDGRLSAFAWDDIARALDLRSGCGD